MTSQELKPQRHSRASGRVTIVDVARLARVSPMTVSRALKTPALVQLEARDRIAAAIKQLGYVPNQAASTLASAKSQVIGVIVPSLSNSVFVDTLTGIRDSLNQHGYKFLIGESSYSPDKESQLISTYLAHAPDGFLLSGIEQQDALREQLATHNVPAVRMFDLNPENSEVTVGFSHEDAGYSIARHLIERGYRQPGFLGAQLDPRMMKRRHGFRKALSEAGINPDIEVLTPAPSTVELGTKMLGQILQQTPACDAVFCCNDDLALGVLFECQRRGLSVPGQMAIAGFNDLPWSAFANPGITTIVTPRYDIGFTAAQLLIKLLRHETPETTSVDLGFKLAIRSST
ncbi:transcriptional regulator GntR [Collimonas fungivorans]|uniref:Transcriptional regulator GntR n=1 Tax=Collimonas fungivorans TaxID=158899 RepID=A0A127PJE0_9BURK|nr:LacI family DNA-binding transcriptional regulator [Collimonas fungivorans]AMO97929.1 transcriptional regulator GntR [Collimonas fungivorans]